MVSWHRWQCILLANGFDCNLDDPNAGWAAISWWTAGADIAVDSRMTFGPFDISSNALTRLEFFEVICLWRDAK